MNIQQKYTLPLDSTFVDGEHDWANTGYPNTLEVSLLDVLKWEKNAVSIYIVLFKPKTWERNLFIEWAAIRTTSPIDFCNVFWNKKALVIFSKWPFFLSTTPFC